jgi:hypothetical protein
MQEIIAYCGVACHECVAFLATQANDDQKRAEVAQLWSTQHHLNLRPEDINCDGCLLENGRIMAHCAACEIRKCSQPKHITTCAACEEYACAKLSKFFTKRLDEIRARM